MALIYSEERTLRTGTMVTSSASFSTKTKKLSPGYRWLGGYSFSLSAFREISLPHVNLLAFS